MTTTGAGGAGGGSLWSPTDACRNAGIGVTVTSSYAGPPADMRVALDLIAAGRVDPTATVSHRLSLDQAAEGFRLTAEAGASLKVILSP